MNLVTGGAGFIGSHLVKYLKTKDETVISWDKSTGQDVCTEDTKLKFNYIYHLACPVNPGDYKSVALETLKASSIGTMRMAELALKSNAKFLYVSSSEIYGDIQDKPFTEDYFGYTDPIGKRSFYDESKRFGEAVTAAYHHYYGLDMRIIRPFNIYGPGVRDDDTRVIPSFFRNYRDNKPLEVTGDGSATRSFCYIDDFIDGIYRAMTFDTNGEIFNLGTTEAISMKELAHKISPNVKYVEARNSEQHHRLPDITKAKKLLSWEPKISLDEGLALTWESYPLS